MNQQARGTFLYLRQLSQTGQVWCFHLLCLLPRLALSTEMVGVAKLGLLLALIFGAGYVFEHTSSEIVQGAAKLVLVRAFFVSLQLLGNILVGDDSILSINMN